MKINIVTRCTRIENLPKVKESVFSNPAEIEVIWNIVFDTSVLKEFDSNLLQELHYNENIRLYLRLIHNESI